MTKDKTIKGNLYGVPVTATIKGNPDYTPTTEQVRTTYAQAPYWDDFHEEQAAEFDRWLAEVKKQAVAEWLAERMAAFEKADLEAYQYGEIE